MSTSTTEEDRKRLYHLTNRILNVHFLHFILISLLFLPFTISAYAVAKFYFSSSLCTDITDITTMFEPFNLFLIKTIIASSQNLLTLKTLIILLTFISFVILPTVAGIALITYITHQAIHCKPLTFSSTLKSLSRSFLPLLHTFITASITPIILFIVFTLLPIAVTEAVKSQGFDIDLVTFSLSINLIASYALAIVIVFFLVIWGSAGAITVLESKSGFETLRQSANQSKEFRGHSFWILKITGLIFGTAMLYSLFSPKLDSTANWIIMILQVGFFHVLSLLMILVYVVANTVLYMQSKGEENAKTAVEGEVSGEYVRMDVNDEDGEAGKEVANGDLNYMLCLIAIISVILLCVELGVAWQSLKC